MSPVAMQVAGLVLGVLLLQVLIWVPVSLWLRARNRRAAAALSAELAATGERVIRGPESGVYRGATDRFGRVKGNGTMVLTDRRVVFQKILGARVEVPFAELAKVREARAFLGSVNSMMVAVLVLRDGNEVGFSFADHASWMAVFREQLPDA